VLYCFPTIARNGDMQQRPMSVCDKRESGLTILVVDDEDGVIQAIRETLRDSGHQLITTTDPCQALEILGSNAPVHLLITDLFMPTMSGARLLRESRRIRPGLKAVLLTGLASPEEFDRQRRRGESMVLKPWTQEEFTTVVAKELGGSKSAARRAAVL
jgi:CheY-like chemotaxis protein